MSLSKPRNFVVKNAQATTGGNAASMHKNKKTAFDNGNVKHKGKIHNEDHLIISGIIPSLYIDMSDQGLEGPLLLVSGKVVYYDPTAGQYYDIDTGMHLSYSQVQGHRTNNLDYSSKIAGEKTHTELHVDRSVRSFLNTNSDIENMFYTKLVDNFQKTLPALVTPMTGIDSEK
jgi:hypothetical protein